MPSRRRGKRIRVAGVNYLCLSPYRLLREIEEIDYMEGTPAENALALHERDVDVALVPASEFAMHGGYVSLDYGLGCRANSGTVLLHARQPIEKLHTIYLYEGSRTTSLLLRLLLRERWRAAPQLIRLDARSEIPEPGENEGVLIRYEVPYDPHPRLPIVVDLATEWFNFSGLPLVLLLWSVRPGLLQLSEHQLLHQVFRQATLAAHEIAVDHALLYQVQSDRLQGAFRHTHAYYLDEEFREGLQRFFGIASRNRMLPHSNYQSATYLPLNRQVRESTRQQSMHRLLQRVSEVQRLSIAEATYVARNGELADIGMAAELVRKRYWPRQRISHVHHLGVVQKQVSLEFERAIEQRIGEGTTHIVFQAGPQLLEYVGVAEAFLMQLKSRFPVFLEGFSLRQLLELARNSGTTAECVIGRLVTAGLDAVSTLGRGLLLGRRDCDCSDFPVTHYFGAMKLVHRFGAKCCCVLPLEADDSWEDRFVHLQQLRALQDETPGFHHFMCEVRGMWSRPPSLEMRLRALALGRLFMDNVISVEVHALLDELLPLVSLGFGVDSIRFLGPSLGREAIGDCELSAAQMLRSLGVEVDDAAFPDLPPIEVH